MMVVNVTVPAVISMNIGIICWILILPLVIFVTVLMLALVLRHLIHWHQTKELSPSRILLQMYCLLLQHTNDMLRLEYLLHILPSLSLIHI